MPISAAPTTVYNEGPIVEARKLEHQYPHALKVEHRGS